MCFTRASARFLAIAVCVCSLTGCDRHGLVFIVGPEFDDTFSFETGLSDWTGRGKDLTNPTDTWEVVRSPDRASEGAQSVRLTLNNLNSQGKIWIERKYAVEKNQTYTIQISYDFASADSGSVNLWTPVAGVAPDSPATVGAPAARGDTGNGQTTDQGFKWLSKSYPAEAASDKDGELFVYVGVWGTSVFARTYYVDNLKVVLTRKGITTEKP